MSESGKRVLLAGCGDIGFQLGLLLQCEGFDVMALKRTSVTEWPFPVVTADLQDPNSLRKLSGEYDYIVYTATPDKHDPEGYEAAYVNGLRNLLHRAMPQKRLLLVSSSGVYGQSCGEWIDESSVTEPARFSGKILLQSEQLAYSLCDSVTVVRFSGIYGPGRLRNIRRVQEGQEIIEQPPQFTNRIHRDDCVAVLKFLIEMDVSGKELEPLYLASDDASVPEHEVMDYIADTLDLPRLPRKAASVALGRNKRCNNHKLKDFGFQFRYPTYREGYQQIMEHAGLL